MTYKTFIKVFVFIGLILFGYVMGMKTESVNAKPQSETEYSDCGCILTEPKEIVEVTFQNGHVFAFENKDGDWMQGDLVTITFNNNGTPVITDDIILNYKYSGWISKSEMKIWIKEGN